MYFVRELKQITGTYRNFLSFSVSICFRYSILDFILRTIEALSVLDDYSREICSNKEVFWLVSDLVRLPDKAEV